MSGTLLSACRILYVDHIAVTTADLPKTLAEYLTMDGYRLLKGPGWNPDQKVHYAFVQKPGETTIELLSGNAGSPVFQHVKRGGGPYHFCYAVADLQAAIAGAKALGATVVSEPTADIAFDGRKVAFLMHKLHGVFELVEAFPAGQLHPAAGQAASSQQPSAPAVPDAPSRIPSTAGGPREDRLTKVFLSVFPRLDRASAASAALDQTEEWDSLAHIQLMMEVESEFEVRFSPHEIAKAKNFQSILGLLPGGGR